MDRNQIMQVRARMRAVGYHEPMFIPDISEVAEVSWSELALGIPLLLIIGFFAVSPLMLILRYFFDP
jgi:hypothetical protein